MKRQADRFLLTPYSITTRTCTPGNVPFSFVMAVKSGGGTLRFGATVNQGLARKVKRQYAPVSD
jgi:hypothetical protein